MSNPQILEKTPYKQFIADAKPGSRVVYYQEIYGDALTPSNALQSMSKHSAPVALVEFTPCSTRSYAFVGIEPLASFSATNHDCQITLDNQTQTQQGDPFNLLRQLQDQLSIVGSHSATQLTGGAIGFASYDAIRLIESIPDRHPNPDHFPDLQFTFFRHGIYFDQVKQRIYVSTIIDIGTDNPAVYYDAAKQKMATLIEQILNACPTTLTQSDNNNPSTQAAATAFDSDIDDDTYADMVKQAQTYINRGDAFQIVPSRTFYKTFTGQPIALYQALKQISPSPYHFFLQENDTTIIGASPEKIISVFNRHIDSVPLAGTIARDHEQDDKVVIEQLLNDPKEIAEHMMLVDLARNDVGQVATPGSVTVSRLAYPLILSHVIHIASDVSGELDANYDALDAFKATFPAGTLSGAPKIRAMEIIDTIEHSRRGLYGGAIIALDRQGNLETCIAIRTAVIKDNTIRVRVGAGIVHDSEPLREAQETHHKTCGIMTAIQLAEQGEIK